MLRIAVAFVLLLSQQLDQTDACTCVPWVGHTDDICIASGYENCTTLYKNHTASSQTDLIDKCRDISPDGSGQPLTIVSIEEYQALERYLQGIGYGYTETSPRFSCSQMYATLAVVTALNSTHLTFTFSTTPPVVWVLDLTHPNATDILEDNPTMDDTLVLHFRASPDDVVGEGRSQKLLMKFSSNFTGEHLTICSMPQGSCPMGQCIIRGDPHIEQFDGDHFLFSGFCRYILSETLPDAAEEFNITGTFVYFKPGSTRTMIQEVLIHVRNMTIEMNTDGTVKVDGVVVVATTDPQDVGHGVKLYLDPTDFPRTVVDLHGVLNVELTTPVGGLKRKGHIAIINIPETYGVYLNGLCGNLNGDATDDDNPCDGGPPADCFVDDDSCA